MWPFRRQVKKTSVNPVPEEIKAYYQSESKDKLWKIWVLSILTFLVTLLIILALFWAGRGLYRHFNRPAETPIKEVKQSQPKKPQADSRSNDNNTGTQPAAPQPAPQTTTPPTTGPSSSAPLADTGPGNVDL